MGNDVITAGIIGAAIDVHRELGPGLLESSYEACLCFELAQRGFGTERQKKLPLVYKAVRLEIGYRLDVLVNDSVIVEIKSVERIERIHFATVLTYLKLSGKAVALLINFNVPVLKNGIHRIVH